MTRSFDRTTLWYSQPAGEWLQALPIGNGRLGAMVYGGVEREQLALNEDTLWSGGPHCYDNPEALSHLAAARAALAKGEYTRAQELGDKMMGIPVHQQAYQPLGDLYLEMGHAGEATDYVRSLNMASGVSEVVYRVGDMRYTRETIASRPDEAIVMRLECDKPGQIGFGLSMTSPHACESVVLPDGSLLLTGQVGPREDNNLSGPWEGEGMRFAAKVSVTAEGGQVAGEGDAIMVVGADAATIRIAAATEYVNYRDVSADPVARVAAYLAGSAEKPWDQMYADHVADHSALFGRVSIDLGGAKDDDTPTDKRNKSVAEGALAPLLCEQFFQYGRYLMIAGSRPGTQALNLQGIWNDKLYPPWCSKYTININIQMNYWVAEVCNLSECHEPLFRLIDELQVPGAETARVHYGAGGWVAHHNTDPWRGTAPVDGAQWGMWQTGGAWLCQHLWEHWLYTGDDKHLEASYLAIKGAAQFFLDFLISNDEGYLVTSPSLSPEHSHGGTYADGKSNRREGATNCIAPTMDMEILRDLFANCIKAGEILGVDEAFRSELADACSRLAPLQIGQYGQLQEWYVEWDNPDDPHSHVSHLYGLYPSAQINRYDAPELFDAARTSLVHRGKWGGWPGAWRISLWARAGDGDQAHEVLTHYVMGHLTDNLFNARSVFQIDANFGATAGIAEMLLQSHCDQIDLLPALPSAWPTGSVQGLCARGGYTVDMQWKDGALIEAVIRAGKDGLCRLRAGATVVVKQADEAVETEQIEEGLIAFKAESGNAYRIVAG